MTPDQVLLFPGTGAALVLALFGVYKALSRDNAKRFDAYTERLEERLGSVERRLNRYQHRVYQLEAILRAHGIPVPPWTATPDDIDELGAHLTDPLEGGR